MFPAARCGSSSPRWRPSSARCCSVAAPAGAQDAGLEESEPADGAELNAPPDQIVLRFDGEVGNANQVSVACNSNPFTAISQPTRSDDNRTLTVDDPRADAGGHVQRRLDGQPSRPARSGPPDRFTFEILASPISTTATTVPGTTAGGGRTTEDGADTGEDEVLDASEVSDGATWLGRVLSTLGLAVLFGSLVLIVAAWPEGPEYILAVRFLRSVWLLTLGRHAALRRRPQRRGARASRSATA